MLQTQALHKFCLYDVCKKVGRVYRIPLVALYTELSKEQSQSLEQAKRILLLAGKSQNRLVQCPLTLLQGRRCLCSSKAKASLI